MLPCTSFKVCKDGVYRILGRTSVDIIKSGGYKIRWEFKGFFLGLINFVLSLVYYTLKIGH